jgi:hypothetical protein
MQPAQRWVRRRPWVCALDTLVAPFVSLAFIAAGPGQALVVVFFVLTVVVGG